MSVDVSPVNYSDSDSEVPINYGSENYCPENCHPRKINRICCFAYYAKSTLAHKYNGNFLAVQCCTICTSIGFYKFSDKIRNLTKSTMAHTMGWQYCGLLVHPILLRTPKINSISIMLFSLLWGLPQQVILDSRIWSKAKKLSIYLMHAYFGFVNCIVRCLMQSCVRWSLRSAYANRYTNHYKLDILH